MLQSRSSYRKLKSLALSLLSKKTVDQTTRERVATTNAVDDRVDVIVLALIELLTIIDKSLPAVVCSRERFAESRNNIFESELLHHALEDSVVTLSISLTALYVSIWLEAQAELSIFLITDANINILHQRTHNRDSLLRSPELLAEVEVNRNSYAVTLSSLTSQLGKFSSLVADSWSNTAPMEPLGTLHNLIEIEIRWVSLSNCAVCTVVDYLGWAHRSTSLGIVETYAVATTSDELCINAVTTETVDSNLTDLVLRELRYEVSIMTIVSQAYSYVSLTTTRDDAK